jgi:transposase
MADGGEAAEDYRRRNRRSWSLDQKLAVLEDLARSGDPLAEVARRHGMNANHLLSWRKQSRAGTLGRRRGRPPERGSALGFVQVDVTSATAVAVPATLEADDRIEVELPGGAKVRFAASLDPGRLHAVLRTVRAAL